jgi:hypothetical protein
MGAPGIRSESGESPWRTFRHGIVSGTLGYFATALFYLVFNAITGRPVLGTAILLGNTLLKRPVTEGVGLVEPAPFFVFNGLHLSAFLVIGLIAAWFISQTDRHPWLWYLLFCLGIFVFFHLWGITLVFARDVTAFVPSWTILTSTLLAVVAMAVYFWFIDADLRRTVMRTDLEEVSR